MLLHLYFYISSYAIKTREGDRQIGFEGVGWSWRVCSVGVIVMFLEVGGV